MASGILEGRLLELVVGASRKLLVLPGGRKLSSDGPQLTSWKDRQMHEREKEQELSMGQSTDIEDEIVLQTKKSAF